MLWGFHEGFDYDDTMKYILMTSLVYDWNVQILMGKILDVNFIDFLGMLMKKCLWIPMQNTL